MAKQQGWERRRPRRPGTALCQVDHRRFSLEPHKDPGGSRTIPSAPAPPFLPQKGPHGLRSAPCCSPDSAGGLTPRPREVRKRWVRVPHTVSPARPFTFTLKMDQRNH